jgi:uncharacterized protein
MVTERTSVGRAAAAPNKLITEKSLYLLQHAHNPVNWYPWGPEALDRARKENKPIFLSIGYSSCHWCHVMEHESFEDEGIARILNENFVSIKVDREERPDLDELYMKAVMSMTGSGGWPLNVFLTPKLEPFYGGTYFPKDSRYGLQGFGLILKSIAQSWKTEPAKIGESASQIRNLLAESYVVPSEGTRIDAHVLDDCFTVLAQAYDQKSGGFSIAPKFPSPSNLLFLLRYHRRSGEKAPLQMVLRTLDFMRSGGIHDHIGGGFHRYSTDREWLIPHFEKMLYDNALLSIVYCEAYQITKDPSYKRIVLETLDWILRDMTSRETGGFFSSQDADTEEGEGMFYAWNRKEIAEALKGLRESEGKLSSLSPATILWEYYGVSEKGNFENGKSVLTTSPSRLESISRENAISILEASQLAERANHLLLEYRSKRPKPSTDDKILVGWNGLMISAMSKAYQIFREARFLEAAKASSEFILENLSKDENGGIQLFRRYRDGEKGGVAVLEDYAFLANGLIDLYETCFEPKYIETSIQVCDKMIELFYDSNASGFFETTDSRDENLIIRLKDAYDGAIPSGNSIAALVLLRLFEFTGRKEYREKAAGTLAAFWKSLENQPASLTQMLVALDFYLGPTKEIILSGNYDDERTKAFIEAFHDQYIPNAVLALVDARVKALAGLFEGRLFAKGFPPRAFVCSNFSCKLPATSLSEFLDYLRS